MSAKLKSWLDYKNVPGTSDPLKQDFQFNLYRLLFLDVEKN